MKDCDRDVRKMLHDIVDRMVDDVEVRVRVRYSKQLLDVDNHKNRFQPGPGRSVTIDLSIPWSNDPNTFRGKVEVERLERSEWRACDWMQLQVGDIVRFRDPFGGIQRDHGYKDPETGKVYVEIRDWIVKAPPKPGDVKVPMSVYVEPRDADEERVL